MGACPFCGAAVGHEILVNGGHCPSCLIEIPGEETPTDPGEAARAQIAAEQEAASGGSGKFVALGAIGLLVLGVGGYFAFGQPEPEVQPMQIEMGEFSFAPMSAHEDLEAPEGEGSEDAVADAGPSASAKRGGGSTSGSAGGSAGRAPSASATAAASAEPPPPTGGQLQSDGPEGDPLDAVFFGDGPSQKGVKAIVLCKPGEIYEGVRSVLKVKSPQLAQCYQRALKSNEGLRGRWMASFVVQKSGKPAEVKAVGQSMKDATLEACVVTQIERWSFPQLCEPMPIETPLSFGM